MTYEEVEKELKELPKTKEDTKIFVGKYLAHIAFDFHTRFGLPLEMFEEMLKETKFNLAEQVIFILNYYKNK